MKLAQAPQDVAIQGNFETSDFNLGDVAFIIDMFADKVYTNKVRAVLRELSCNAHDAHVVAGTTDIPFDVHLPTKLEPYFTIRDYGTGLSDAEVRSIFCGIGISTKRDSDDVIGCFGIGSLSPYSLGDSFTVRSYYNGMMRTYNCYRDNLRKPKVALLTEVETDEQNGLEISVNVDPKVSYNSNGDTDWAAEALFVYRHWKGTSFALNDDSVVEKLQEQQYQVKGDFYGFTGNYGALYAVMGNIAYDMYDIVTGYDWRSSAGYIEFEMGELDFDTARENLSITDKTKAAVEAKLEKVKECASADIQAHIESLPTQWDRAVYCERLSSRLSRFMKPSVLDRYKLPTCSTDIVYYNSSGKGTSHRLFLSKGTRYFLDKRGYVGRIKAAVKEARETFFVLTQEQADEMMVPAELLEDLEVLPKVYRSNGTARAAGSNIKVFTFHHAGTRWGRDNKDYWKESEIDTTADEIVYVEINRWCPDKVETYPNKPLRKANSNAGIRSIQQDLHYFGIKEPVIVGLKSAFCRSNAFTESDKYIRYEDWLHREINRVAQESGFVAQDYSHVDLKKIKAIAEYVQSDELDKILSYTKQNELVVYLERAAEIWDIKFETESSTKLQESMDNFLDKYGMLRYTSECLIDNDSKQDIANYINGTIKGDDNED